MQTPWGKSDNTIRIARGVVYVNTPSHGGFLFTRDAAHKYLTEEAILAAETFGSFGWGTGRYVFEEDVKYAIVLFEHPEWDAKLRKTEDSLEKIKEDALHTISAWDADYLIARGIEPEPKGYARWLQNKEEDRLRQKTRRTCRRY